VLFRRERIQETARAFDGFGNFAGAAPASAFEKQVLDEMRDTGKLDRLVAPTHANP